MLDQTKPDLTLVFDAEKLWPKAGACPDWPLTIGMMAPTFNRSREAALSRLVSLGRRLNQNWAPHLLRTPTEAERADLMSRYFVARQGAFDQRWAALGIADTWPVTVHADVAGMIVEAVHLRGYLRKLGVSESEIDAARKQNLSLVS